MGRMIDITGNKYNRLTVLEKTTQKSGSNYLKNKEDISNA